MGTKNNPGKFDCYEKAEPDEPMFVLLARDPVAGALVRLWAVMRETLRLDPGKQTEAERCARAMDDWYRKIRPSDGRFVYAGLELIPYEMLKRELERRGATVATAASAGNYEWPKSHEVEITVDPFELKTVRSSEC